VDGVSPLTSKERRIANRPWRLGSIRPWLVRSTRQSQGSIWPWRCTRLACAHPGRIFRRDRSLPVIFPMLLGVSFWITWPAHYRSAGVLVAPFTTQGWQSSFSLLWSTAGWDFGPGSPNNAFARSFVASSTLCSGVWVLCLGIRSCSPPLPASLSCALPFPSTFVLSSSYKRSGSKGGTPPSFHASFFVCDTPWLFLCGHLLHPLIVQTWSGSTSPPL